MKIIEVLHSFWTGNRTESPRNRKSWGQLEKAIKEVVPQDKQEDFTRMIEDHSDSVEYSGFVAGFRIAAKLWREYDRFGHFIIMTEYKLLRDIIPEK